MQKENRLKILLVILLLVFLIGFFFIAQIFSFKEKKEGILVKENPSDVSEKEKIPSEVPAPEMSKFFGGTVSSIRDNVLSVEGNVTVSKLNPSNTASNEPKTTTIEPRTVTCSISEETKFTNAQKEEVHDAHLEKGISVYIEYEEKDNMACRVTLVEMLSLKGME